MKINMKIKKILIIFLFIFIFGTLYTNTTYATNSISELIQQADNFIGAGNTVEETIDEENLQLTSDHIFNILTIIAICTAVIIGAILGIKILISTPEEKAQIQQLIIPYIVGCIVAFSAFTIWRIAITMGQTIFE